jgi:hypothetical protein
MRSIDDRAEIRSLFLRFPLEDCLKMMEPSLLSTGAIAGMPSAWDVMQPFPAETLALWESVSRQTDDWLHPAGELPHSTFCFRVLLPLIFMTSCSSGLVPIV